jgi:hypothetical protein
MAVIDGIQRPQQEIFQRQPVVTKVVPKTQFNPPKLPSIKINLRIPKYLWILPLLIGFGLVAIPIARQFTVEASALPLLAHNSVTSAPNPVTFAQTVHATNSADQTIVIDQPLSNSKLQPEQIVNGTNNTALGASTIRILNGGNTSESVDQMTKLLEDKQFQILSIGSAQFSYVKTTIYYLSGHKDSAKEIAKLIGKPDTILTEDPIASPAAVLIVLGADTE